MSIHLQILGLFAWTLLAGSALGCVYLWYACHAVARFCSRAAPLLPAGAAPPVSILKPLHGEDAALAENLRSFCRQDYPAFQLVFGVADAGDPAIAAVKALMAEFPSRDIALVVDSRRGGANFKVANLGNMLPSARHPILVIADSDMRVAPSYLAEVAAPLLEGGATPAAGLVTCLYRGVSSGGLWSDLASLHINHGFLPQAAVAERIGRGAGCFGATMALTRATLDAAGGFEALGDTLADDRELGQAVRRSGRAVVLSPRLVDNIVAEPGFAALYRHELRWARTIRLAAPAGFAGSVITNPVPLALLAAALGVLPLAAPAMLALALLSRWLTARRIDRALGLAPRSPWLLPLRDLLS
ncbi:MAG: bacteriohopanetetrol glucosamine biosynthesis glycosyltransferase HpnI, partial [Stellaceae bacterium]